MIHGGYRIVIACGFLVNAAGCASGPPPAPPEVAVESITIQAQFDAVWQATKTALVAEDYEIYTRDRRGMFVAYTKKKGTFSIPNRSRVTVILERATPNSTNVTVEAVRERYRMPLLRYPGWTEQPEVDLTSVRQSVLSGIESEVAKSIEASPPAV